MLFRQFVDDDLGCASYLIGDEDSGVAVVVDPAYEIDRYLEQAEADGVRLMRVLETHTHADHVSGHGRLALEQGLPVSIHPAAEPEYAFEPLEDGQEIDLGAVTIRVLHTPGPRPEHCAFEVVDGERGDEPWLTLTGDSLFVGDAASPDLASEAAEGARGLYSSLQRLIAASRRRRDLSRPRLGLAVRDGHELEGVVDDRLRASLQSRAPGERRGEFVADAIKTGVRPPNMERIVELNRGPFVGSPTPLEPLNGGGAGVVLDVRAADEFAAGHAKGALSVPVAGGNFPTKAGFVLPPDERVVLHAASAEQAERAAGGLRAVAIFDLAGYLVGPPNEERLAPIELGEVERLVDSGQVELLDVREPHERDEGYIPGSRNIPYRLVREWVDDLQGGKPVVTICSSGPRAAVAASVLAAAGIDARPVVNGGVPDWKGETVSFRRCGT